MYIIYSLVIGVYSALICMAGLFIDKARLWCRGRQGQGRFLKKDIKKWEGLDIFWVHAASYGEFEMSWPLIEQIRKNYPEARFVVSFYSPSGFENIYLDADYFIKIYLPVDLYFYQKAYVRIINPKAVFFIKYEYWYNLLRVLKYEKIPYYFVGMHLEPESYIFWAVMNPFKKLIASATSILAHSEKTKLVLEANGFRNVRVFGDMRVQRAEKNLLKQTQEIVWPEAHNACIIYGSVSNFELPYVLKAIQKLDDCNHIVAPHDVEELFFEKIRDEGVEYSRISKSHIASSKLMLIDNYGELKYMYGQADIAYIGGGFEKGPHNIIEAMIFKCPIIIGNRINKFPFAKACQEEGMIEVIDSPEKLAASIKKLLSVNNLQEADTVNTFLQTYRARLELIDEELEKI